MVVFDRLAPAAGIVTLVAVGLLTEMLTPVLKLLPPALNASETRVYDALGTVIVSQLETHP